MERPASRVTLKVHANIGYGDEIYLVGDSEETGAWNLSRAMKFVTSPSTFPVWVQSRDITVDRGVTFNYKYAIFRSGRFLEWENIGDSKNRKIEVPGNALALFVEDKLNNVDPLKVSTTVAHDEESTLGSAGAASSAGMARSVSTDSVASHKSVGISDSDNVIVVSYVLPVVLKKSEYGTWTVEWDDGNLLAAKTNLHVINPLKVTWIGTAPASIPVEEREAVRVALGPYRCVPVWLNEDVARKHFDGYCKGTLWPVLHNIIDVYGEYPTKWWNEKTHVENWQSYMTVNRIFSDKVVEECSNHNDVIWIHDYPLLLLPSFLARRLRNANIGLFLHTPFPSSEIFRTLSVREELLRGMLNADHIGFHLYEYGRHFMTCCRRIIGVPCDVNENGYLTVDYGGREIRVTVSCGHIEPSVVTSHVDTESVQSVFRQLRSKYAGKKVIAGIAPMERLRGISLQMSAYEAFLHGNPSWVGKVVYVQYGISEPHRHADWMNTRELVEASVKRINEAFGEGTVVYKEFPNMALSQRLGLWMATDIYFACSIRNGLSLQPMEFICAKHHMGEANGISILSEFCGIVRVLNGGIRVNPWQQDNIVQALKQALNMGDAERRRRCMTDAKVVMGYSASQWAVHMLKDIKSSKKHEERLHFITTGLGLGFRMVGLNSTFCELKSDEVCQAFRRSFRRAILLDFGGTIVSEDNVKKFRGLNVAGATVMIPDKVKGLLNELSKDPMNTVFLISGKERKPLEEAVAGIDGLGIAAEQGFYFRWTPAEEWQMIGEIADESWRELSSGIMEIYTRRTNGTYIERKGSALLWMYRDADYEFGSMQAKELHDHLKGVLKNFPVEIIEGKGYIEIRPEGVNKGAMVERILSIMRSRSKSPVDFVLCIGDDATDEPMFKKLEGEVDAPSPLAVTSAATAPSPMVSGRCTHFTVTVGKKPSAAKFFLNTVDDVVELLDSLVKLSSAGYKKHIQSMTDLRSLDLVESLPSPVSYKFAGTKGGLGVGASMLNLSSLRKSSSTVGSSAFSTKPFTSPEAKHSLRKFATEGSVTTPTIGESKVRASFDEYFSHLEAKEGETEGGEGVFLGSLEDEHADEEDDEDGPFL